MNQLNYFIQNAILQLYGMNSYDMGAVLKVSLKYYEATFSNASKSDKPNISWMR